nr:Myc-type, basic helix-loop-helix (bHLH) domain-containing protein [Tanacetum cinerariifolium]
MVPLMLQQAMGMLAHPKEKKLKEMESERSGSHGSTSMETPNNSNNGSRLKKIEIEAYKDDVSLCVGSLLSQM